MALYYNLVFGLLVIEMAFFTVLSLPFPRAMRKSVLRTVSMPFRSEQFQIAFKCVFGFVLVLFIDSVNRVYTVTLELHALSPSTNSPTSMMNDRSEVQARRFYAQRNMYLCGFTLFLTLILTRTYSLVAELIDTKDKLDANKSLAGAKGVSAESSALKKDLADKDAELSRLKTQASSLAADYDAESSK
ncbi:B-cell receptor-associated 31-like protein [Metschnikowia bicuspidata var. bicuspidata NRRL YB-4993]|uniref:Endoplasmic reticulum transmembrane protein n=1 Tax=Metschnikowia bicuspidata var. bicuspidata NRRL YB-4993 TaxID=869754 RepID=A0A1A0HEH5_9ASCO|nr:B-cell receptor-associated 31-like protein [Metschnikowia bicuspidata var. bicuspidata NRRL YB-4993]OBA22514.1 B-cell receptor-associated 31-like protein [Metschnikowia bicuspidata var. bicuspidata NRRL YB-4993]